MIRESNVSLGFIKQLLVTRKDRALQRLNLQEINDPALAAAAGELVGTDPNKEWSFSGQLLGCATEFCLAALHLPAHQRYSSLTELNVYAQHQEQVLFATLLTLTPTMRSFAIDFQTEVRMK